MIVAPQEDRRRRPKAKINGHKIAITQNTGN